MSSSPAVVVLATRNRHKLRELSRMLEGSPVELKLLDDVLADAPELEETGDTFRDNAVMKAMKAASLTGLPAIADDSGLEVDALGGAPGVRSARFAGGHGDTDANNSLLLEKLADVPDEQRTARFRCVIAFVDPGAGAEAPLLETFSGSCEGRIDREPRGEGGFGYDPLFVVPDWGVTVAQLAPADKDQISHRGEATRQLASFLRSYLSGETTS